MRFGLHFVISLEVGLPGCQGGLSGTSTNLGELNGLYLRLRNQNLPNLPNKFVLDNFKLNNISFCCCIPNSLFTYHNKPLSICCQVIPVSETNNYNLIKALESRILYFLFSLLLFWFIYWFLKKMCLFFCLTNVVH